MDKIFDFVKNNAIACIVCLVILVVLVVVLLIVLFLLKNKNRNKEDKGICENILLFLGGKQNISFIEAKGSRLVVSLINKELINDEELKKLGVTSILKMSNKITLVIGNISQKIVEVYNNQ